jgi:hypothetical protein
LGAVLFTAAQFLVRIERRMDVAALEARVNGLADVVAELVEVVKRLNIETYKESYGPEWVKRVDESRPRVLGYEDAQKILNELGSTLDSWRAEGSGGPDET